MSFDWSKYLNRAEYMMASSNTFPDEEACYRSVISRAYYAVYCSTRNLIEQTDSFSASGNVHQELQSYLINHPHKPRKKIGNQLKQLHKHRIKADYHDDLDEMAINKASRAIAQAKKIQESLGQL